MTSASLLDLAFYRWGAWFAFNGIWPGRDESNHKAQRELGAYSMKCLENIKVRL